MNSKFEQLTQRIAQNDDISLEKARLICSEFILYLSDSFEEFTVNVPYYCDASEE